MNSRQSKFLAWINYRVRVIIQDNRHLVGTLLAFDKHMNLILADTEEFTRIKSKKSEGGVDRERKRSLGLVILRGENIVSFSAEVPPSNNTDMFNEIKKEGEGMSVPIGRGQNIDMSSIMNMNNQMKGMNPINMNIGNMGSMGRGIIPPNMMNMPQNMQNMGMKLPMMNMPQNMNNMGMKMPIMMNNMGMKMPMMNMPQNINNIGNTMMRPGVNPMMGQMGGNLNGSNGVTNNLVNTNSNNTNVTGNSNSNGTAQTSIPNNQPQN